MIEVVSSENVKAVFVMAGQRVAKFRQTLDFHLLGESDSERRERLEGYFQE